MFLNNFKTNKNKKIIIFLLILFFLFSYQKTHAAIPGILIGLTTLTALIAGGLILTGQSLFVLKGISYVVMLIADGIKTIIFYFIGFANYFLELTINLNLQFKNNAVLEKGWLITRDISNLFIIIILIIIAFAIILRIKDYGSQKILISLIITAILINFSLEIGYIFIDFTNSLTLFFKKSSGLNDSESISTALSAAINPQNLLYFPELDKIEENAEMAKFANFFVFVLITAAFIIFFSLILLFVILTYSIMFIIRYVYLTILLILFPLVLTLKLIPEFKQYHQDWWKKFISWTFFAPTSFFFLFLSIATVNDIKFDNLTAEEILFQTDQMTNKMNLVIVHFFNVGAQLIVILGLLLGGLIAAQKMGVSFADSALKFTQQQSKNISKTASKKAKEFGFNVATKAATLPTYIPRFDKIAQGAATWGQNRGFILRTLTSPVRKIGLGLSKLQEKKEDLVKKAEEKDKDKSLKQRAMEFSTVSNPQKIATLKAIANEGKDKRKKIKDTAEKIRENEEDIASLKKQRDSTKDKGKKIEIDIKITQKQRETEKLKKEQERNKDDYKKFKNEILSKLPKSISLALRHTDFKLDLEKLIPALKNLKAKGFNVPISEKTLRSYLNNYNSKSKENKKN